MAYGSSAFGSEAYGSSSNITLLGVITYFLSGHLSKVNITITFTLDAKIVSRLEKTFTLDAKIVSRLEKTFTLDTSLQKSFSKTFTINTYLKKFDSEKIFSIDAKLIRRRETVINIDGVTKKTFVKTFTIGARSYVVLHWLTPWKFRKSKIITGTAAGIQTNFTMTTLTVYAGVGTDTANTVFCNNHINADFNDLRFTKQDGRTLLNYWIETISPGISAIVHVMLDYIPKNPDITSVYMYYGNPQATNTSNISTAFILGDHFDGTLLDSTKWDVNTAGSTYNISDSNLSIDGKRGLIYGIPTIILKNGIDINYMLLAKATHNTLDSLGDINFWLIDSTHYYAIQHETRIGANNDDDVVFKDGAITGSIAAARHEWIVEDWIKYSISIKDTIDITRTSESNPSDTISTTGISNTRSFATTAKKIGFSGDGAPPDLTAGGKFIVDWVGIRKFASPEPLWDAWGKQETLQNNRNIMRTHRVGIKFFNG